MSNIIVVKSTKLFYKEYPYKIVYKRLYGFPSRRIMAEWWVDAPATDDDCQRRMNCHLFIKGLRSAKFMNSGYTHVYFKATSRYTDLQCEHHTPILDNLAEVINGHAANIDLKANLYHKKFRYKVNIRFNDHLESKLGPSLYSMYSDNSNYHLNPNMKRFAPDTSPIRYSYSGYAYTFRHSIYNTYAVYCRETIDMEMLTFVAGENIAKITKALLIAEIDKR